MKRVGQRSRRVRMIHFESMPEMQKEQNSVRHCVRETKIALEKGIQPLGALPLRNVPIWRLRPSSTKLLLLFWEDATHFGPTPSSSSSLNFTQCFPSFLLSNLAFLYSLFQPPSYTARKPPRVHLASIQQLLGTSRRQITGIQAESIIINNKNRLSFMELLE